MAAREEDRLNEISRLRTQLEGANETVDRLENQVQEKDSASRMRRDKNMLKQKKKLEKFIEKPWARKFDNENPLHMGCGQSIQCVFSCYEIKRRKKRDLNDKRKNGEITSRVYKDEIKKITFTLDEIVDEIIENDRWFNPNSKRNGIRPNSCDTMTSYTRTGVKIIYMEDCDPMKKKAIKHGLSANVLNETNFSKKLTRAGVPSRVSESSAIVKGWIKSKGRHTYSLA